jgi:hypothetical protein
VGDDRGVGTLITVVVALTYDRSLVGGDDAHARAMAMVALTTASASVTAVLSRLATVGRVAGAARAHPAKHDHCDPRPDRRAAWRRR